VIPLCWERTETARNLRTRPQRATGRMRSSKVEEHVPASFYVGAKAPTPTRTPAAGARSSRIYMVPVPATVSQGRPTSHVCR
jgi:hypothetical protein